MTVFSAAVFALALPVPQPVDATALDREARHIETMLIAPCCWAQPVAQHQSQASDEVKQQIRALLAAGRSRQEVLDAFAAKYGPRILAEPPVRGFGGVLYGGLASAFVLTGAALVLWVRRASRRSADAAAVRPAPAVDRDEYAARLDDELRDMD